MKVLRILLAIAAGLILLFLIALIVIVARFDADSHKPELVALVKEKTSRTLAIEGPLKLQTLGRTVPALKKALSGAARVDLKNGSIKGINLAEALRKAKAALGSKAAQEQAASKSEKTDFSELTASFSIRNGVAHNEDLTVKSPFIRLGGAGDIDVGEGRLSYLARASVVNTSAGQGGKDLDALRGLTVPVRVSGPFDALTYRIDVGAFAGETVKQKLEESLKGRLEDSLKGLFPR